MVAWGANPVRLGGDWSRKGNRKGETLCPLFSNICNVFLAAEPFQEDADLVLSGMVLARGAAISRTSFSAGTRVGRAEDFWLIFTLRRVRMSQKSSVIQVANLAPWVLTPDRSSPAAAPSH